MALNTAQIATNASTATCLLVQGGTPQSPVTGEFYNISGSAGDPLPVMIKNMDASITIYVGGANVTSSNGYPLLAGQSFPLSLVGAGDLPYAIAASATPKMAVIVGRQ